MLLTQVFTLFEVKWFNVWGIKYQRKGLKNFLDDNIQKIATIIVIIIVTNLHGIFFINYISFVILVKRKSSQIESEQLTISSSILFFLPSNWCYFLSFFFFFFWAFSFWTELLHYLCMCVYINFEIWSVELYAFTDSPRDSVQFIEWSPTCCPRALLVANFHGRVTIWTQPSQVSQSYLSRYFYNHNFLHNMVV